MDYNEKIYLALRAGSAISVDNCDAQRVATAMRRRLRQHEAQAKVLGMSITRKTITISAHAENPALSVLQMKDRPVPTYTILPTESQT